MTQCWAENPKDRLGFNEVVAELNRISKELEASPKNGRCNRNKSINQHQSQQKSGLEDIAEETPLIKAEDNIERNGEKKNGMKHVFSHILRQRR